MNWVRINQALQFAAKAHDGQYYKYKNDEPQISHLYFTVSFLQNFNFDEDTIIAGALHDSVEDTDTTIKDIKNAFGGQVASIVEEVTYDQSIPWKERQDLMQKTIASASESAKAVKTADVFHQLILFFDQDGQKLAISNYLNKHTKEEVIWKYGSLIESITHNWDHLAAEEAKQLLQKFKDIYSS